MLRRKRTDVFTIRLYCDECGKEMEFQPSQIKSQMNPTPLNKHACECGEIQMVDGEPYPRLQFEDIQENIAQSQTPKDETEQ